MTKTFERFLRAFTDEDLVAFAQERGELQPPYWRVMRLALDIEAGRRGIELEREPIEVVSTSSDMGAARVGTA